jgi:hypothetical protein
MLRPRNRARPQRAQSALSLIVFAVSAAASAAELPSVSAPTLRTHAEFFAHDLLEGRETGERGHELAALYAESLFRAAGLEPGAGDSYRQVVPFRRARRLEASFAGGPPGALEPFVWRDDFLIGPSTAHETIASPNVIAKFPGADPVLAREVVVVTAHLDHIGVGAEVNGDTIYNGYFDNALGSALVLEIARALAVAPARPARTVLFALVTGEERGLLGSDYFAHYPTVPLDSIVANVNFDTPLLAGPIVDLVAFGAEHSTLGEMARQAAETHGFRLAPDPLPEEAFFVRSDQYSFVRRGVPAIFLDVGGYEAMPGGVDAETYLRRHYHLPSDDARLPVDWESARRYAAASLDLVRRVAAAPERPRWHPGDFFGERFGSSRGLPAE